MTFVSNLVRFPCLRCGAFRKPYKWQLLRRRLTFLPPPFSHHSAMFPHALFIALQILLQFTFCSAYSWKLNAAPKQCSNLSISITGSDGLPPYNVLVVPFGPTPFQNKIDVRGVIYQSFDGSSKSVSVAFDYPANTQFVAVVSQGNLYSHVFFFFF